MALERRIDSLKKRHAELDLKLLAESTRPSADPDRIYALKCHKLKLKDEMMWLEQSSRQQSAA